MGIVGTIVVLGLYALLILAFFKLRSEAQVMDGMPQWPHRVLGFLVLLSTLFLVDSYVVRIPSPFAPAELSLPNHSQPPPAVTPLILKVPEKTGPSAKEEHSKVLKEWSASE